VNPTNHLHPTAVSAFPFAVATSKVSKAEQEQRILEFDNLRRISAMFDGPHLALTSSGRNSACFACSHNSSLIIVNSAPIRRAFLGPEADENSAAISGSAWWQARRQ
jgi:hypothetical protein